MRRLHRPSLVLILAVLAVLAVLAAGCDKKPPEGKYIVEGSAHATPGPASTPTAPPIDPSAAARPTVDSSAAAQPGSAAIEIAGLTLTPDPAWRTQTPASPMRKVQFSVGDAANPAGVVVFHFGAGQGGDVEANLVRWARLVLDDQGQPTLPTIKEHDVGSLHMTLATYTGTYLAGTPGSEKTPMPGWTLIAGVIENGPDGTLYPRLVGPSAVVAGARESFVRFVKSAAATP